MVLCIIFFLEILLHQTSLAVGYAKYLLHQIRLIVVFVSQQFSTLMEEFRQPRVVHDLRHFAEEDSGTSDEEDEEVRYDGQIQEIQDIRYHGLMNRNNNIRQNGHVYLIVESNVQHTLLTDYVDMSSNPTYVILDSGCTRAMGSRFAIDRLVRACTNHRYSHLIKFTKEASNNRFSFANGGSSHVKEKLVIH